MQGDEVLPIIIVQLAVTVDAQAKIITFVADGVLNDGGAARQYGWGGIDAALGEVNGLPRVTIAPELYGEVKTLRIYGRALSTSESVGNFRAGR